MKPSGTNKPHLIITVGIPGSGKSFFAEHFADTFKAPIVSFDRLYQGLSFNVDWKDIQKVANYMLDEMLKTKQTIIYEGPTDLKAYRTDISKKARNAGYEPLFIWIQTEPATARRRATKPTNNRPALTNDQFDASLKRFNSPNQSEKAIVISGKYTYASQLKIVLKHLASEATKINKPNAQTSPLKSRSILIS